MGTPWLPVLLLPVVNLFLAVPAWQGQAVPSLFWLAREIGIAVFASAGEEILFRGFLFRRLVSRARLSPVAAALAVSVLFAALHLGNLLTYAAPSYAAAQAVMAFCVSLCLCGLVSRYSTIRYGVIMHVLTNLTSIVPESGPLTVGGTELILYGLVSLLYLAFSTCLFKPRA